MADVKEQTSNPAEWAGFKAPRGYELGWKVVRPDGRTYNDFQWSFKGRVVADPGEREFTTGDPCPLFEGDGLCVARTWAGAASNGIVAVTGLALAYKPANVLCESDDKIRVSECRVLGALDLQRLIRGGHASAANLYEANLFVADLRGANLHGANLGLADLCGADLRGANLHGANLHGANLHGADLHAADLHAANLYEANLRGAVNKDLAYGLQS